MSTEDELIQTDDISDFLGLRAKQNPQKTAFIFLKDGKFEHDRITYEDLNARALALAGHLQQSLEKGQLALLIYPTSIDYVCAFWACLYAGIIAVPTYQPRRNREDIRLETIALDSGACCILTHTKIAKQILPSLKNCPVLQSLPVICTDQAFTGSLTPLEKHSAADLAFLQYTSGSTGTPKGVMISRGNLHHNAYYIHRKAELANSTTTVTWLPSFHDMGLMTGIILPVVSDMLCIMMTPTAFLQQPLRWIKAVSKYQANFSGGPNFAYDLCVQRAGEAELDGLDLSSWFCAFNGAEQVRATTLEQFTKTFVNTGFKADNFFPCYGLAENTVAVAGDLVSASPLTMQVNAESIEKGFIRRTINGVHNMIFTSCGHTSYDIQLQIVDPENFMSLNEEEVGEIWIAGPSVALGYWNKPALSYSTFQAYLSDGQGPFLRSGDLGFLKDGQLYVTGRLKDLIIIRGRNHYPQDIELSVERSHPALAPSAGAAFSVTDEESEHLIIVQEVQRTHTRRLDLEAVFKEIRQAITKHHELTVRSIVLLKPGHLPKTSSGKVRRNQCQQDYLAGLLEVFGQWDAIHPATEEIAEMLKFQDETNEEKQLYSILAQVIDSDHFQRDKTATFSELGLDSLLLITFHSNLQHRLNKHISLDTLIDYDSIESLAIYLNENGYDFSTDTTNQPTFFEKAPLLSHYPATAEQRRYWHIQKSRGTVESLLIPVRLRVETVLDKSMLKRALASLITRHSMLRTAFDETGDLCIREHIPADINYLDEGKPTSPSWDLAQTPLWHLSVQISDEHSILALQIHHSIADLWSVQVFFKELSTLYLAWANAQVNPLTALEAQFEDYAYTEHKASTQLQEKLVYWESLPYQCFEPIKLPYKRNFQHTGIHRANSLSMDITTSSEMKAYCKAHKLTPASIYLAVLRVLVLAYSGQNDIIIGLPLFNRHHSTWQKLIGCFAQVSYLHLPAANNTSLVAFIQDVAKALNKLHQNALGLEYSAARLLKHRAGTEMPALQLMFNYMSLERELDRLFGGYSQLLASSRDSIDFEMTWTFIESKQDCRLTVEYATTLFDAGTVRLLTSQFAEILEAVLSQPELTFGEINALLSIPVRKQLVVGASFSADPLFRSIDYWLDKFESRYDIRSLGFNQLFSALTNPDSLFHQNPNGVNVILLRLYDWLATVDIARELTAKTDEFLELLHHATASTPYLLVLCPEPLMQAEVRENLTRIKRIATTFKNVSVIEGEQLAAKYAITTIHDLVADQAAALPYTDSFFGGLGTEISRRVFQYWKPKFKLIAVDGDNTLWQGIVGEDGVAGVTLPPAYQCFQEKLLALKENGILLALLSKNTSTDIVKLFEQRHDFPLKQSDFVAWAVNWQPKSQNLQELAAQLNLDLAHFLFIDDNPVEIAELKSACPTVSTLLFPSAISAVEQFVEHIWFLDPPPVISSEDRHRTQMYTENNQRQLVRQQVDSFKQFIESLALDIRIAPMNDSQVERVSQLSQRVNQFNATGLRCSITDVEAIHGNGRQTILTVEVSDRFGDYGLTGAAFLENRNAELRVKNLLLSCRVLGRGVEYALLRYIGCLAMEQNLHSVQLDFIESSRNQPLHCFYQNLNAFTNPEHRIDASTLSQLVFQPTEQENKDDFATVGKNSDHSKTEIPAHVFNRTLGSQEMADLWLVKSVINQDSFPSDKPLQRYPNQQKLTLPHTDNERKVLQIWQDILQHEHISTTVSFSEAGGTSIDSVRLLSALCKHTGINFPYAFVLENNTIQAIAAALDYHAETGSLPAAECFPHRQDANLPETLQEQIISSRYAPPASLQSGLEDVLLTGATGYLGAYILHELLVQTSFRVNCLVRATSSEEGLARVKANLQQYNLWKTDFEVRIAVVVGDFSQPAFALSADAYAVLSEKISRIYHNGANVNFSLPYAALKPANVNGTLHILDFASQGPRKSLNYVSTASVFDSRYYQQDQQQAETPMPEDSYAVFGGYAQSKWVAERLVSQAAQLGMTVNIFRFNGIGPAVNVNHSRFNNKDAFSIILLASINMRKFFDLPLNVDFAPADYVAAAMIKISLSSPDEQITDRIFSLTNPQSQSLVKVTAYLKELGEPAELLPYHDWLAEIENYAQQSGNQALSSLLPLLNEPLTEDGLSWLELSTTRPQFLCTNTTQILQETGLRCRETNKRAIMELLLLAYVTHNYQQINGEIKAARQPDCEHLAKDGILILSWSLGEGHNIQSAALKQQLQQHTSWPIHIIQLGEWMSLVARLEGFWQHLAKSDLALLNQYMQITQDCQQHELETFRCIYSHTAKHLSQSLRPKLVISLCPAGSQLLRYFKQVNSRVATVTGVADWFGGDFKEWADEGADWIYSPSPQCTTYLQSVSNTTPPVITGSPIMQPAFNQTHILIRQQALQQLGLATDTRLMMFNTYGDPASLELIKEVKDIDCHILILCYKDGETKRVAMQLQSHIPANLIVKSWLTDMPLWLAAAQTVFTKPGPGICAEAIKLGVVPLLNSLHGIMRQEQSVHRELTNALLALDINCAEAFRAAIRQWLDGAATFKQIQHNINAYSIDSGAVEFARLLEPV